MTENFFQALVVWTLFITTIAQAIIHARTWVALGPQPKHDSLATELRAREGSLAVKGLVRASFEFLLLLLVVDGKLPLSARERDVIYVVTAMGAVYAVWRGIRFLNALRKENWGWPPESKSARDERQDAREDGLDQRAKGLDKRGWDMSKESMKQNVQQRDMDKREFALDSREQE